ncbi:MAG: HAMP domain-containing sensor histidine kinase [Polyangiaceae bacterium]
MPSPVFVVNHPPIGHRMGHDAAMPAQTWLTLAAALAYFALAVVVTLRGGGRPLSVQVSLTSIGLAAYSVLDELEVQAGEPRWDALAYAVAALLAIPTFDLVVSFVGQRRRQTTLRVVSGALLVALALISALPALGVAAPMSRTTWAAAFALVATPLFGYGGLLLFRHAARSPAAERARTRLLLGAMALGVGGNVVDLVLIATGSPLRLSQLPLLLAWILIVALVLRVRLIADAAVMTVVTVAAMIMVAALALVTIVSTLGSQLGLAATLTVLVLVALAAAIRPVLLAAEEQRRRGRELLALGRLSSQMAHDLKNPIAAIVGAAQFLLEEAAQGRPLDDQRAFVELILERGQRMTAVVERYQRLGRTDALRDAVDLGELVRQCVEAQALASDAHLELDLAEDLPRQMLDADLVRGALENLLANAQNAVATRPEAKIVVGTEARPDGVAIVVADEGVGMDARTLERACDDFFTTRAEGSGLGLAFALRVARAHDGQLILDSRLGEGTTVTLELAAPAARTRPAPS